MHSLKECSMSYTWHVWEKLPAFCENGLSVFVCLTVSHNKRGISRELLEMVTFASWLWSSHHSQPCGSGQTAMVRVPTRAGNKCAEICRDTPSKLPEQGQQLHAWHKNSHTLKSVIYKLLSCMWISYILSTYLQQWATQELIEHQTPWCIPFI
jgi:hypothetical protein